MIDDLVFQFQWATKMCIQIYSGVSMTLLWSEGVIISRWTTRWTLRGSVGGSPGSTSSSLKFADGH